MPQRVDGADLPSAASASVSRRNVLGGSRPDARHPETEGIELPVSLEAARVPPTASMTADAVPRTEVEMAAESPIAAKLVHAALTSQEFLPRLWPTPPDFGTIARMVSKPESLEGTQAVAERLRMTREAFRMNKATWCKFVDISPQAWSGVEGTKNSPALNRIALDQALKVCRATGVGLNWIYRGSRDDIPVKVAMEIARLESEAASPQKRKKAGKAG